MQQGTRYLLIGLALLVAAIGLLLDNRSLQYLTAQTIMGAIIIGMVTFGLLFMFVAIEEFRMHIPSERKAEESARKRK